MNPRRDRQPVPRAFTLVEALAAITILATVLTVSSGLIIHAADGYADTAAVATATNDADAAMSTITNLLRLIPRAAGGSLAPDITSVTSTSITWTSGESLALSGSNIVHTHPGGATSNTLIHGVSAFSVRCYDQSNAALAASLSGAACAAVHRIEVTLTVARNGSTAALRTRVFPRALINGGAP